MKIYMTPKMRRKDREMSRDWAIEELRRADYGFLGTVGLDGIPYVVPVNHACDGDIIFFHCAPEGRKLDNIRHNPNVSFAVSTQHEVVPESFTTRYRSAIAFGRAEIVTDNAEKLALITRLAERLAPGVPMDCKGAMLEKTTMVKIRIQHVTGKMLTE